MFSKKGRWNLSQTALPPTLAELMEKLVCDANLRERMGVYNRHYAQDHFRDREVAERLKLIHREVYSGIQIDA